MFAQVTETVVAVTKTPIAHEGSPSLVMTVHLDGCEAVNLRTSVTLYKPGSARHLHYMHLGTRR